MWPDRFSAAWRDTQVYVLNWYDTMSAGDVCVKQLCQASRCSVTKLPTKLMCVLLRLLVIAAWDKLSPDTSRDLLSFFIREVQVRQGRLLLDSCKAASLAQTRCYCCCSTMRYCGSLTS